MQQHTFNRLRIEMQLEEDSLHTVSICDVLLTNDRIAAKCVSNWTFHPTLTLKYFEL